MNNPDHEGWDMIEIKEEAGRRGAERALLIGRREHVEFPEWGLKRVRAKVDTGAYSSTLDVAGYELLDSEAGPEAHLRLVLNRRRPERVRAVRAPVVAFTTVRSSIGCQERRPVIEALVRLGPVSRRIRLTVTNRSRMRYRMLLGREALKGAFLVDVAGKDLLAHPPQP